MSFPLSSPVAGTLDTHGDLSWVQLGLVRKRTELAEMDFFQFRQAYQPLQCTQPCAGQCGTVVPELVNSELPR